MSTALSLAAIWHDTECGGYTVDLPLWRRLAAEAAGPVLEIGAGTGRVTIDLSRRGHDATALDCDGDLLDELARRAATLNQNGNDQPLRLSTVQADARDFELGRAFALIIAPMQVIQLLDGPGGRARFLHCAASHLARGGRLAVAVTERFDLYDDRHQDRSLLPAPDVREVAGTVYRSYPVAVLQEGQAIVLERRREALAEGGRRVIEEHRLRLDVLTAGQLEQEAQATGLRPARQAEVPATDEHVGSVVVMLDA